MTLRTDLLLDPFGGRVADAVRAAQAAEDAGFDGIWTWDHLAGRVHGASHVLECWTLLTTIAARTERVAIGPLVLNVANREPGVVAVMAATLQEASGKALARHRRRRRPGTPYPEEQRALGRSVAGGESPGAGRARSRRSVTCGPAEYGFLRPDPPPPIVIGGFGPKMAALAGRIGDGFNTPASQPQLGDLIDAARRAHKGDDFLATASASLSPRWVSEDSGQRERLRALGVTRLILGVPAPYDSMPVHVKAGSIVPTGPEIACTDVAAGIGSGPPIDRDSIDELRRPRRPPRRARRTAPVGRSAVGAHEGPHPRCSRVSGSTRLGRGTSDMNHQLVLATSSIGWRRRTRRHGGASPTTRSPARSSRCEQSATSDASRGSTPRRPTTSPSCERSSRSAQRIGHRGPRRATWWPRPEDRATIAFAGGRLLLSGRFDLVVGGRPTPIEQ